MAPPEQQVFQAHIDSLPPALAFVEACCARHGVARADTLRLVLVVEELFTNTVVHGHGGGAASPVHIEVAVGLDRMTLRYEDCAPPFDPLHQLQQAQPDLDAAADERSVGGLGLTLVARLAERFDYARDEGFNRLQLVLRRGG